MLEVITSKKNLGVFILITILFFSIPSLAQYSGGTGEPNDPYRIAEPNDWVELMNTESDWDKNFIMTADIDVNGIALTPVGTSSSKSFKGVFDGNDHIIHNVDVNMPTQDYVGLFGYVANNGQITSLGEENLKIIVDNHVGGLVGDNYGTVTNCYSNGTVSGDRYVGGLVGYNYGTVTNCYSSATVSGYYYYVGGLVGTNSYGRWTNSYGSVSNCYSSGTVSGDQYVGGLVGSNDYGCSITNCYSTGTVSGDGNIGGLVGFGSDSWILYSVWDIETSGLSKSDGGVGLTTDQMMDPNILGLFGFTNNPNWVLDAGNDYMRLAWEDTPGQIIGEPVIDWMEGSGIEENPYKIGTAEQLILLGKVVPLCDSNFVLVSDINLDPNLADSQVFDQAVIPTFTGVFDGNDHTISNMVIDGISYLGLFGKLESGAEIRNLGITDVNITGSYDYIGGLVGSNGGTVTNCYSTGMVSGGNYDRVSVGGIVGYNYGNMTDCYSTGTVISSDGRSVNVGGLVGYNDDGNITNCFSTGTVINASSDSFPNYNYIGGLVGSNGGTVTNCYSTGTVSGYEYLGMGEDNIGGLVGENYGTITNCYSIATVSGYSIWIGGLVGANWGGTISNCFWDKDIFGFDMGIIEGAIGKTTNEMQDINTYLAAGWDFASNGSDSDPNWIFRYNDYPHLAWEYPTWGEIPDVNGMSIFEAIDIITSAGFSLGYISTEINENLPEGYVVGQNPDMDSMGILGFTKFGLTISCPGQFSAGSGTESDPFQISTVYDWLSLSDHSEYWGENFVLTNDVNIMELPITPIGSENVPFTGYFDGNGHSVCNAVIKRGNYTGLFGYLMDGHIYNLGSENNFIDGSSHIGGLAGYTDPNSSINSCYADCTVTGYLYIGGLVGVNDGTVTNCYSTGTVSGDYYIGGLVGYNYGTVTNSCSTGTVSGDGNIGGLVGSNEGGSITNCYSTSTVSSDGDIGGLVGINEGGNITNCYSTGTVSGGGWAVGGLVGYNDSTVTNCYSTGTVSGGYGVSGLVGRNYGDTNNCIWDIETSGLSKSDGGVGLTTDQMMDPNILGLLGFTNNPNWVLDAGNDYPRLAWEGTPGQIIGEPVIDWMEGSGTEENPYKIGTAEQLILLGKVVPLCDSNFVLVSDINLDPNLADSQVFDQVIIPTFTGVFDGNDHTISNMVINGYSYLGLFGKLESGAEIKNLGITDVNITGSSDYIGGLVGYNYGTVTNCYSTGTVSGDDYIGGLVGYNYGTVINCYSSGTVSGNKEVGGLVGESKDGIITNCYSTGTVSGYWDVGGLVGLNYGDVTNCYSSCTVHGNGCVGGLLGQNPYGNITYCYSTGTASGDDNIGGLVGYKGSETISNCYSIGTVSGGVGIGGLVGSNIYSTVTNCYSTGTISGNEEVGGLVGYNNANSSVENCYSSGSVSGYYYVGGLVGYNNDNSSVENCYSSGSVSGDSVIGGLVGYSLDSTINNCYSNNTVSGTTAIGGLVGYNSKGTVFNCYCTSFVEGNNYIGGMIGYNNLSEVNYCFWDFEVSTIIDGIGNMDPDPNGVIGKTTIEMYDPNTFLDAGWDFIGETINGPNDVWWILEGKDYPYLWWQLPVDDFNDCDAAPLWLAYEPEPELAHLEEVNGRLEVNTAGAMEDLDAIYIPYNWALDANKPFSVQVDFHFSKIGTGDGRVNIGIVPSLDPSANKWAEFEVGTFDDNPFYLYEIRDGIWEEEQTCSRFLEDGTLFISYDPNSDELYFSSLDYGKDNAIWTVPDLIRAQWQCESIYIIISGGSEDGMALTGEDAWLDNFKVQEGTITQ